MSVCDRDDRQGAPLRIWRCARAVTGRNLDVVLQGVPAVVGTSVSGLGGQEVLGIGGAGELLA